MGNWQQFESNQSGIETAVVLSVPLSAFSFESNQSGIEAVYAGWIIAIFCSLNRTRVELKRLICSLRNAIFIQV